MNITEDDIKATITGMVSSFDRELFEKSEEELETYWLFTWDSEVSLVGNIYEFHEMLTLYGRFCRRWEDHHNGYVCIVERVRDKYLLPKIRAFADIISNAPITNPSPTKSKS